jgi:deoxyribose-phosphate aldolase
MSSHPLPDSVASLMDHTLLRADATAEQVDALCADAVRYGFAAVCVNPWCVRRAAGSLKEEGVAVCSVAGFPLGGSTGWTKSTEAQGAVADGATEIDVVINVGAFKSGNRTVVEEELSLVRRSIGGALLKVILELPLLSASEAEEACRIAITCGADYVKTGTGFGPRGVTVEDVTILRRVAGPAVGVKAAGGIRTLSFAKELLASGATRLGTSWAKSIADEELGEER